MTDIGHIYKIICTVEPTFCYIGSTFDVLWKRMGAHRNGYTKWLKNKKRGCSCFPYFEKYGVENFKIVLIKSYEVCRAHDKDRMHLEAYETLWVNRHKGKCCNEVLPLNLLKKEKYKEYAQNNKAKISQYKKEYNQNNKAKIAEQKKEYAQNNKAKIAEQKKEKVKCECGCTVARGDLAKHRKTKKHIQLMASK